jgi:hypothetical protein
MPDITYIDHAPADLIARPLWWQLKGLSCTATGYGARIPTDKMLRVGKRLYRVYATCYGNAASCWVTIRGQRLYLRG